MSGTAKSWERLIDPEAGISFRSLGQDGVVEESGGIRVDPDVLTRLARTAFHETAYFMAGTHVDRIAAILDDPAASLPERQVAAALLRNAAIAAEGVFPLCQDTGTATVFGFKGEGVRTGADDAQALSEGVRAAWASLPLRHSQMAPRTLFDEVNTGDNLPAQVEIRAVPGDAYRFLFMAKGAGSSNKTVLIQGTKALLNEAALERLMTDTIAALGVSACPPYRMASVIGGTSPEANLLLLKLAGAGYLDTLPGVGTTDGIPFRDQAWEDRLMTIARESGWGAQFGGRHLASEARVIRLPRHAGSCPISFGVSCSAHRQARALIDARGVFLEKLDHNPARWLTRANSVPGIEKRIDLNRPTDVILEDLRRFGAGCVVSLDGDVILSRDVAHARFRDRLRAGAGLPAYLQRYPVYYAGPAQTPEGHVIGSLGPTTSQRMDAYVPELMAQGGSRIMLGKGPRSADVAEACRTYGGAYLAVIGGAAALLARDHVVETEILDFAELGMEAVRRVRVRGMPALIAIDPSGRAAGSLPGNPPPKS